MSARECNTCRVSVDEITDDACEECDIDTNSNWQPSYAALFQRVKEAEVAVREVKSNAQVITDYTEKYPVALIKEVTYLEGTISELKS